jgi:hypothetical protein
MRALRKVSNFIGIPFDITNRAVDLGERDFHAV